MNLNYVQTFVRIAENKSFSQTARELYLTQPTVSCQIAHLEGDLGVRLFLRTTEGALLTEAGRRIYTYAKQITESAEHMYDAVSAGSSSSLSA